MRIATSWWFLLCSLLFVTSSLLTVALPATGQTLAVVRVIGPAVDGYTPAYVGQKLGIFKKYGLDVQLSIAPSGAAAAAALSGGAADVSYGNIISVIQAHAHNIPLQFLVPGGMATPQTGLVHAYVLKDSPIVKASDLNGKTLASPALRDLNSAVTMAWMDQNGGDSKTLHQIELPAAAAVPALQAHRADLVVISEPAASQAMATGLVREVGETLSALGGTTLAAGYTALAPTVSANSESYVRFAQAMREAEAYTNAHPRETAEVLASFSGMAVDQIRTSRRNIYPPALDPKVLQRLIDLCSHYGLISNSFPATEIISPAAVKLH
jgi:NitT/TauT family transport system substrate-binding protein